MGSPHSPIVFKRQSGFRRPKIPKRLAYFLESSSPLAYPPYGWIQAIKSPNASHRSAFAVGTPLFHYTGAINDPHGLRHKVPAESTLAHQPSCGFPHAQKCRCGSQVLRSPAAPWSVLARKHSSPDPMLTNHSSFSQITRIPWVALSVSPNLDVQSRIEVEAVKTAALRCMPRQFNYEQAASAVSPDWRSGVEPSSSHGHHIGVGSPDVILYIGVATRGDEAIMGSPKPKVNT